VKNFYRDSAAVFLVYNIAEYYMVVYSHKSFEELEYYYTESIDNCSSNPVIALIGAQKDR
jgi:hypothetical protein